MCSSLCAPNFVCTMYVTLTDIQNGEPVYLASVPATAWKCLTRVVLGAPENALGWLWRSGGYRWIREGWGGGTAVWPPAVRRGVQTKKGRHPRGRWGAEARRVEGCGSFICRPQTASHAGVYWEQVGRLCGPCSRNGLAFGCQSFGSLRGDGPAAQDSEGDNCLYPAVFLRPRDQERGRRAIAGQSFS